jgi:hypothetical protein
MPKHKPTAAEPGPGPAKAKPAADRELMRLSLELEALLAAWMELKRRSEERRAAIDAAVKEATGLSDEDAFKFGMQSIIGAFGGEVSSNARRYLAIESQIKKRFPEIGDDEWQRVTVPLEFVIDQVLSIRPETLAGLGVHARAIQYFFESGMHLTDDENSKVKQFLDDTMRLAGLPRRMVASSNLDADTADFVKNWGVKLDAKIHKQWREWFDANKKWDARNQHWYANGSDPSENEESRRKLAEEARREAKFGAPRLIAPPRQGELPLVLTPAS